MPRTPIGKYIGNVEEFNLLLEQEMENFLIGRGVRRMEWKPDTVSVSEFKNHSAVAYQPVKALGRNIIKPNAKIITGGELLNIELRDFLQKFEITRRWVDTVKQMRSQASGGPSAEAVITSMFQRAAISAYAVTGEALLNEVLDNANNFVTENIVALDSPVDTSDNASELVKRVLIAIQDLQLRVGGSRYRKDMTVGDGESASPYKLVVPLSVMNGLSALLEAFNIVIPYNGMGNSGDVRTPSPEVLSQLFKGVEVIVPQAIQIGDDGVKYYDDGNPEFVFEGNYMILLYSDPDILRPSSLVYHHTPLETEAEADIFEQEIKLYQRVEVEIKQANTMYKITNILSDAYYKEFAGIA